MPEQPKPDSSLRPDDVAVPRPDTARPPDGNTPAGPQAPLHLAVGQRPVGDYELIEFLGGGGFGQVWKAASPDGLAVALKFVQLDARAGAVEQRALDVIKEVHHPHLLALFRSWQQGGYLVLAMELADTSLLHRLNESPAGIPRDELLEYLREAAKGLDHLNAQNIQHRDVKPHNLLLSGGSVKVADFGLAKLLQHTLTGNSGAMTISYAAPEFFRNETSSRSDQYSLAVTYCQLRGGRLPYTGTSEMVMIGHILHPPDLTMLPEAERAVVLRALAKQPAERWPSCKAFVEALIQASTGRVVPDTEPPPDEPFPPTLEQKAPPWTRKPPRRRGPLLVAAMLLVVLGGGGLALILRPDKTEQTTPTTKVVQADPPNTEPTTKKLPQQPKPEPKAEVKPPVLPPSLTLYAPPKVTVDAEGREKLDVEVQRSNGSGPVEVEVTGLPAGVTAKAVTLKDGDDKGHVELLASDAATPGERTVTVQARFGSVRQSRPVTLTVRVTPRLRLLPVEAVTVEAGKSQRVEVRVERRNCLGPVRLVLGELPDGVYAKAVSIPADADRAAVELTTAESVTPLAGHTVHVEAFADGPRAEGRFELTIRPVADPGTMTNTIGMKLVRIPAGKFTMGSPEKEEGRFDSEGPQRQVVISQSFYLGVTEVTRGQFRKFVEATGHKTDAEKEESGGYGLNKETGKLERGKQYTWRNAGFDQTDEHPVVNVSWNDAKAFCEWLEKQEPGKKYRLPTEAEWEYSCRANSTTRFHSGEDEESLVSVANVADASAKKQFPGWMCIKGDDGYVFTAPVGKFKPNAFGLYDMHGNVWEWCQDVYKDDYYKGRPNPDTDPQGPEPAAGSFRVIRGGSFTDGVRYVRAAVRYVRAAVRVRRDPARRSVFVGFRVLCVR